MSGFGSRVAGREGVRAFFDYAMQGLMNHPPQERGLLFWQNSKPTQGRYMAKKSQSKKLRAKGAAVVDGIRTARGAKMLKGPWKLVSPHLLEFPATLIDTINIGKTRLAIFSVPKRM